MKVYVILTESLTDGETEVSAYVFATRKKAKAEFDKIVRYEKENDHLMERDDTIINEDEDSFTIYKDGYYSEDHYSVWIEEKKVM